MPGRRTGSRETATVSGDSVAAGCSGAGNGAGTATVTSNDGKTTVSGSTDEREALGVPISTRATVPAVTDPALAMTEILQSPGVAPHLIPQTEAVPFASVVRCSVLVPLGKVPEGSVSGS